jgi:hypothetical protein
MHLAFFAFPSFVNAHLCFFLVALLELIASSSPIFCLCCSLSASLHFASLLRASLVNACFCSFSAMPLLVRYMQYY